MIPAAKKAIAQDLEQTRGALDAARTAVKKASARSDALVEIDIDLFARSRGKIANASGRLDHREADAHRSTYHSPRPIDRKMLERHLEQARRHVALGEQHLSQQLERIAGLERDGHDASDARKLLARFEDLQSMHIAHKDRLARQLGNTA